MRAVEVDHRRAVLGATQFLADLGVAQQARDAGQRLEMVGACAFGRQKQENQIDRLIVDRVEIDVAIKPREQADDARKAGQLAVRDRDAMADAGGAEALALQQRLENRSLGQTRDLGRALGELLQKLLLALRLQRRDDACLRDEIRKIGHGMRTALWKRGNGRHRALDGSKAGSIQPTWPSARR